MTILCFQPFLARHKHLAVASLSLILGLFVQNQGFAQEQQFTAPQAQEIKGLVREYILENPEIITEAITLLQSKQEIEKLDRQRQNLQQLQSELQNPPENTIIGNPDGNVTVVEFFDYNCGYCKSMFDTVLETVQSNNDIRLVLIEFPILGPNSVTASKAALASLNQDLYGPFHQAMMSHKGGLNEATIMTLARGVGINVEKLQEDMKDPDLDKIIEKNRGFAQKLEINGTPALVIGDALIPGAISAERLNDLIQQVQSAG